MQQKIYWIIIVFLTWKIVIIYFLLLFWCLIRSLLGAGI